jgi:(R,R)-butanediol dehydrogenase / meso-butanediol dehydrogenase / diacetyl reductase
MMRTAIFRGADQPILIDQVADPVAGNGEIVIKVGRCGICATDLTMTAEGPIQYEIGAALGHEFSGEIVDTGPGVHLKTGMRVVAMPVAGCGVCQYCRAGEPFSCIKMRPMMGGFGEYTVASADLCFTLPSDLSFADGAIVEPLAVGLHSVQLAKLRKDARVMVIGTGPIALATALWARRHGATVVAMLARSDRNRAIAEHMGVTQFMMIDPEKPIMPEWDYVFECAGAPGMIGLATDLAARRGTVILSGLCMAPDTFIPAVSVFKELKIQASLGYTFAEFNAALDVLAKGAVEARSMVTDTVSLDQLPGQFEAMRTQRSGCKILVDPWAHAHPHS